MFYARWTVNLVWNGARFVVSVLKGKNVGPEATVTSILKTPTRKLVVFKWIFGKATLLNFKSWIKLIYEKMQRNLVLNTSLIQPVKFRIWEMGFSKIVYLEKIGVSVASRNLSAWDNYLIYQSHFSHLDLMRVEYITS